MGSALKGRFCLTYRQGTCSCSLLAGVLVVPVKGFGMPQRCHAQEARKCVDDSTAPVALLAHVHRLQH